MIPTADRRLGKSQSQSECSRKEKNSYPLKLKLFHYIPWRRLGGEEL
jgi:hypothetical protein